MLQLKHIRYYVSTLIRVINDSLDRFLRGLQQNIGDRRDIIHVGVHFCQIH